MNKKTQTKALIILIVGVLLIIIAPMLLIQDFGWVSFGNTGEIGDTIGGVTAPITGLVGSLLVFFALKAQINANDLIFKQFEHQKKEENYRKLNLYITNQIEFIRQDINDIHYTSTRTQGDKKEKINEKGTTAISQTLYICSKMNQNHFDRDIFIEIPNLTLIQILLERTKSLLEKIQSYELNFEDEKHLVEALKYTYLAKLKPFLAKFEHERMSLSKPCQNCNKKHNGIPERIYEVYDKLNIKFDEL